MLTTIRVNPDFPRLAVLLVSVAQTGAVTVFIPFPRPAMILHNRELSKSERGDVGLAYRPVIIKP